MACKSCKQKAVFNNYCKEHFSEYFEKKVIETIKQFKLFKKTDKVMVAASGGKDSTTILYILKKYGYNITALAINEGIENYRDISVEMLKQFCSEHKIKLKIVSFKQELSKTLDEIIIKTQDRPCTVCGILRRYLLNKHSKKYAVLVTGHNLDDEAQAVVMNLVKNNVDALNRQGPGTTDKKGFTRRVKPLYLCPEKEILFYSSINKLQIDFNCCPNIDRSFRLRIKKLLNKIEVEQPEVKRSIVTWFLNYKKDSKEKIIMTKCKLCGENSTKDICNACLYLKKIRD